MTDGIASSRVPSTRKPSVMDIKTSLDKKPSSTDIKEPCDRKPSSTDAKKSSDRRPLVVDKSHSANGEKENKSKKESTSKIALVRNFFKDYISKEIGKK